MQNSETLDLYTQIYRLKKLKRSGWINHKVNEPESVAEHSFALATLAIPLAKKMGLDIERVLLISLIHDLGESVIGDIISPEDEEGMKDKLDLELPAIQQVIGAFPGKEDLLELWLDFEHGRTKEGIFVKELDKIEMCLQALEYEKEQDLDLSEFFDHTRTRVSLPDLKELFNEIEANRPKKK